MFKTTFYVLMAVATVWLIAIGAILYAFSALSLSSQRPQKVADGAIYVTTLILGIALTVAVITPALLLLQPFHLMRVLRAEREAVTPRQRFRGKHQPQRNLKLLLDDADAQLCLAVYPRTYNPSFALACCIWAQVTASTLCIIFPIIGPALALLLFLSLIGTVEVLLRAHRMYRLTASHSTPIPRWLRLRTHSVPNRWSPPNMARPTLRYPPRLPAHAPRSHPPHPRDVARRRRPMWILGRHYPLRRALCHLEDETSGKSLSEQYHSGFAGNI